MLRPAVKTSAQLAEEYTKTLTPAQIAAADQEIYELGLSEPVLCCCEYSQASETTGGKHISHHLCDCIGLEDALFKLCRSCCTDSTAWFAILRSISNKSLLPFPGGAIRIPLEVWGGLLMYMLFQWTGWQLYFEHRPIQTGLGTLMLLAFMGWASVMFARRKTSTEFFFTWFLISVLHDAVTLWQDIFDHGATYPLKGMVLFVSGVAMLFCLWNIRHLATSAHVRHQRKCAASASTSTFTSGSGSGSGSQDVPASFRLRSKHCSICDHRVNVFDHHCPFINCCIFQDNHRWFIGFMALASINVGSIAGMQWSWKGGVVTGTVVYNACILPNLVGLTIYQCVLVSMNLTTNEFLLRDKYVHLIEGQRPFDQGSWYKNMVQFIENKRIGGDGGGGGVCGDGHGNSQV